MSKDPQQMEQPSPDLKSLDRLVGTWELSGEVKGRVQFEWMKGGFFLVQHVDLEYGRKIKDIEVIGHLKQVGGEMSTDIRSRFYDFLTGLTLDYTYELAGQNITIWFGERGSKTCSKEN